MRAQSSPLPLGEGPGVRVQSSPLPLGEGPGVRADCSPGAYRPPLYPLLLTPCVLCGQQNARLAIGILHVALGFATVWLVYVLGRRWGLTDPTAAAAGLLVACNPILLAQSTQVMTETPAALLTVVGLLALTPGRAGGKRGQAPFVPAPSGPFRQMVPVPFPTFAPAGLRRRRRRAGPGRALPAGALDLASRGRRGIRAETPQSGCWHPRSPARARLRRWRRSRRPRQSCWLLGQFATRCSLDGRSSPPLTEATRCCWPTTRISTSGFPPAGGATCGAATNWTPPGECGARQRASGRPAGVPGGLGDDPATTGEVCLCLPGSAGPAVVAAATPPWAGRIGGPPLVAMARGGLVRGQVPAGKHRCLAAGARQQSAEYAVRGTESGARSPEWEVRIVRIRYPRPRLIHPSTFNLHP